MLPSITHVALILISLAIGILLGMDIEITRSKKPEWRAPMLPRAEIRRRKRLGFLLATNRSITK
jgi:ABC-type proline/glycine betaine transport system permease subunit